ncbi:MAG: serine--tRNA ligase [Robiginitomaculum sp.]|nr:MAG: serine--tRNA ligase [Robiginitomaculum sp.]
MHDIRAIAKKPEDFDAAMVRRGLPAQSANLLALDEARREAISIKQDAETERNAASKQIGAAKARGDEAEFQRLRAKVTTLKSAEGDLNEIAVQAEEKLQKALLQLPNQLDKDVPDGADESANKELRKWHSLNRPAPIAMALGFEAKDHTELGENLGLLDFESAAKISGARFAFLKGDLARMERALGAFMLDVQTVEHGFTEVSPPLLVRDNALIGTNQLPKFADDLFEIKSEISELETEIEANEHNLKEYNTLEEMLKEFGTHINDLKGKALMSFQEWSDKGKFFQEWNDEKKHYKSINEMTKIILSAQKRTLVALKKLGDARHWLIPTAEVPLTNLAREAIHDEAGLPHRYAAYTPCFRSEAGSAGKDTRGLIRMHQFMKVEMVVITTPEKSAAEHERMTGCAEEILKRLELPYRVMLLCSGDTGFGAQKTHDLEVWLPSQDTYREISSVSVCGDFQARRMNARFRAAGEKKARFVHTLNGSGLAVGRTLLAVMENYQREDGSIEIPAVIRPYMGGQEVIKPFDKLRTAP